MEPLPQAIELTNAATGAKVAAQIVELTPRIAKKQIDPKWWVLPEVSKGIRAQEHDHHWRWGDRVGNLVNKRGWIEAVAIQTDDENIEGAAIYWINTKSFVDKSLGAVFIEAIATAPHNRSWLVEYPSYRGVGESLLLRAIVHSYDLGLGGRVNLLAFNDVDLISFYKSRGFTIVGYEGAGTDKLTRLELAPAAAQAWLSAEGYEI